MRTMMAKSRRRRRCQAKPPTPAERAPVPPERRKGRHFGGWSPALGVPLPQFWGRGWVRARWLGVSPVGEASGVGAGQDLWGDAASETAVGRKLPPVARVMGSRVSLGWPPTCRRGVERTMSQRVKTSHRIRGTTRLIQAAAQEMRDRSTPAEARLWEALCCRQLDGLRFRRQHPLGRFIVDFCCPSRRLIIELDGPVHEKQQEYDTARTATLTRYGYHVLRFSNDDVLGNLPAVLDRIRACGHLTSHPPPSHPAPRIGGGAGRAPVTSPAATHHPRRSAGVGGPLTDRKTPPQTPPTPPRRTPPLPPPTP